MRKLMGIALLGAMAAYGGTSATAQERVPLQKSEFPAGHESHVMQVTIAPGGVVARHTHPGIEMGYVLEGELTLTVDGKGDQVNKPGMSWSIPAAALHSAKNAGAVPTKILVVYVVEKGKPLATPAP